VQKKSKSVINDMFELIKQRFVNKGTNKVQCGIVYCFSRKDCEVVAAELQRLFRACPGGPRVTIK
jgi:bloom syndrome protein